MATINIADKLSARLAKMVSAAGGEPRVSVGFLAGSLNRKGESIPPIAASNEFGVPEHNQPPRPFFRRMIAEKKPTWANSVALELASTDYDIPKTLANMGQGIKGQLQDSIRDLRDPPLSPVTIAKKARGGVSKSATARGAGWMGPDKPLIDTGDMLNSVDYRVDLD